MNHDLQISHLSVITDALPVLAGAWFYRNISKPLVPVYYFYFFVALQDYFSVLLSLFHIYNVWLMNFYQFIETLFYLIIFHRQLFKEQHRNILIVLGSSISVFWLYTTIFVYDLNEPNSLMRAVTCLLVVFYSGRVLMKLSRDVSVFLFENPFFWIASGCLIYFSVTLLVYSVFPIIVGNDYANPIFRPVWAVHSITNIFCNLLFAITFLCPNKTLRFQQIRSYSFSLSH
ncbi:MAG: hypothetical protein JST18_06260 [Bacteroidetes bacterium]|nr:hypothetical protein [Bacteroidota bacterium]